MIRNLLDSDDPGSFVVGMWCVVALVFVALAAALMGGLLVWAWTS